MRGECCSAVQTTVAASQNKCPIEERKFRLMSYQYQVIVIGSGSAGKEACLAAAKSGLRTLLVEEKSLGGVAFHRGAYAVRALRACATHFKQAAKGPKVGASPDLMETNWTDWRSAQRRNSRRLTVEFNGAIDRENV